MKEKQNKVNFIYKNPNFKYKKNIIPLKEFPNGYSDKFEIFIYNKDNKEYLISPGIDTYLLYIISIYDSQLFKSLKGHEECISVLNYFKKKEKYSDEYILSVDIKGILFIWDINNDFKIKYKIKTKEFVIFSSIIFFIKNNNDFIITSNSYQSEKEISSFSKIYSLSNGKHIKNLKSTNSNKTYYIIPWHDYKNNIYYEIECRLGKISIINILSNNIYYIFVSSYDQEAFSCGFVYLENGYQFLCTASVHGEIKFWDLENKKLAKKFFNRDYNLLSMIHFSDNYIIFADSNKERAFKILEMNNLKLISKIGGKHTSPILCIKEIEHSEYGKCIITSGTDKSIIIWSIK